MAPTRARLKLLGTLTRRSARVETGLFLVEGARLVLEALSSGASVEEVFVTARFEEGEAAGRILTLSATAGVPVARLSERDLGSLAETRTPQGVLAIVRFQPSDPAALAGPGLFLALDGVADPGNVGTLIRAADAFGARAVLAGPGTADFGNAKVLRSAMGSTFHLALFRFPDLALALGDRRRDGSRVLAAVLDGEDLYGANPGGKSVTVVLGNEARGVSPEVLAVSDLRVTVPCPGRAESLNVAMAGCVVLSRLARRGMEVSE